MIAELTEGTLITLWISFTVMMLAGIIAVLVWAVRTRQFRDQDRARYLALRSGIPRDDAPPHDPPKPGAQG